MKSILVLMICFISLAKAQKSVDKIYNLVVGTYTSPGKSQGIYVYSFNTETGDFNFKAESPGISNPSYLAISDDRKNVYSVSEVGAGKGSINAFAFDALSGKLTFLNSVPSGGDDPCYVSVDAKKKFVFAGNYSGGSVSAIRINVDGSLRADIQTFAHEGKSIKSNQEKAHVHAVVLSKDNRYLFVPDLGTDKVYIYRVDGAKSKPLSVSAQPFVTVEAGEGPRHFIFHPNGKYAYLIHEMTGVITTYDYRDGKLKEKQRSSMPSQGFTGLIHAADIHVSPDGNFLYGSLRGDRNEIVIYAVSKKGELTYAGRQSTLGKTPRNFEIDPSGNFLLVGNQNSDEIIIFKRDKSSGLLTDTGKRISIGKPVCLKFVAVN